MKKLVVLLALTTFGARADEKRRLESVTWDPVKHELRWVISKGELEGEKYKPASRQEYEISIDDATMSFADETRRFSKREAGSVRQLLDLLARYAVESTIWWEQGQGEPVRKGVPVFLPEQLRNQCRPATAVSATSRCEAESSARIATQDWHIAVSRAEKNQAVLVWKEKNEFSHP
jgi:hypothetical protein